ELFDAAQCLDPVHTRHLHIEKHELRPPSLEGGNGLGTVRFAPDLVPLVFEELAQRRPDALLVVDHQNAPAHGTRRYRITRPSSTRSSPTASGSVKGSPPGATPSGRGARARRSITAGIALCGIGRSLI